MKRYTDICCNDFFVDVYMFSLAINILMASGVIWYISYNLWSGRKCIVLKKCCALRVVYSSSSLIPSYICRRKDQDKQCIVKFEVFHNLSLRASFYLCWAEVPKWLNGRGHTDVQKSYFNSIRRLGVYFEGMIEYCRCRTWKCMFNRSLLAIRSYFECSCVFNSIRRLDVYNEGMIERWRSVSILIVRGREIWDREESWIYKRRIQVVVL